MDTGWTIGDLVYLNEIDQETEKVEKHLAEQLNDKNLVLPRENLQREFDFFLELRRRLGTLRSLRPKTKVFLSGQTKAGKSTLSNHLIGNKFFIVSGGAETYTGWKIISSTTENYDLNVNYADSIKTESRDSAKKFEELVLSYSRSAQKGKEDFNKIKSIDLVVPSKDIPILNDCDLYDTAGVGEPAMMEKLLLLLRIYFAESTILCVCPMDAGGIKLKDYETILKLFESSEFSKKIIFVLTKFQNLYSGTENELDGASDAEVLQKVNQIIQDSFINLIRESYPSAKITFYDINKNSKNIYYNLDSLEICKDEDNTLSLNKSFIPLSSVEHVRSTIQISARENDKILCEQLRWSLINQINSVLAVIIEFYSTDEFKDRKKRTKLKCDQFLLDCQTEFQEWLCVDAGLEAYLRDVLKKWSKRDGEWRLRKDTYQKDLLDYIKSFLSDTLQNKVLTLFSNYKDKLCELLETEIASLKTEASSINYSYSGTDSVLSGFLMGISGGVLTTLAATVLTGGLLAVGIGVVASIIYVPLNIGLWTKASVQNDVINQVMTELRKKEVVAGFSKTIAESFDALWKELDKALTVLLSGANKEKTQELEKQKLYSELNNIVKGLKVKHV